MGALRRLKIKFHDIEQNTEGWLALRAGKVTGSAFSKVMANYGGVFSEPAKKYAANLAIEKITHNPVSSNYSNDHMERGHQQEPLARMKYESEYFCTVDNGGFFECGRCGVSPDGLVGDDGAIEIKSVIPSTHFRNIKRQSYDPAYKWQLIGNLKYTERDWIDFISFCEDYPPDKKIFVYRLHRDDVLDEMDKMERRLQSFYHLVNATQKTILENPYYLSSKETMQ